MIHKLCTAAVARYAARGSVQPQMQAWCVYALEKRVFSLAGLVLLTAVGLLLAPAEGVVCFLLFFIVLRRRAGGAHMPRAWQCLLVSAAIMVVACLLGRRLLPFAAPAAALLASFAVAAVWLCPPGAHPNMHLTAAQAQKNRRRAQMLVTVQAAAAAAGLLLPVLHTAVLFASMGMAGAAVTLVIWIIIQKRRKNHES